MSDVIGSEDLREVRLYGHLGKRFGRIHHVAVKTAREAAIALAAVVDGFEQHLLRHNAPGYHVFTRRVSVQTNMAEEQLDSPLAPGDAVCFVPAVAGAKKGGLFQTIIGAVLIVVGLFTGNPFLIKLGSAMALGGIVQMLSPVRKGGGDPRNAQVQSYYFDGPLNNSQQGMPIQVVFGEMIIGSSVVSQGIAASDLAI
jgi:predicted phage tail protein